MMSSEPRDHDCCAVCCSCNRFIPRQTSSHFDPYGSERRLADHPARYYTRQERLSRSAGSNLLSRQRFLLPSLRRRGTDWLARLPGNQPRSEELEAERPGDRFGCFGGSRWGYRQFTMDRLRRPLVAYVLRWLPYHDTAAQSYSCRPLLHTRGEEPTPIRPMAETKRAHSVSDSAGNLLCRYGKPRP